MNVKEEEEKEADRQNERGLNDLPVASEQSESTKGGGAPNFAGTWTLEKSQAR